MAQKWAENLSETNVLKHSDYKHKGDQLGENIASKWSSAGADYSGRLIESLDLSGVNKYKYRNLLS